MSTGLVIDDNREFRQTVAGWLKDRHWTVLEADTLAAGLDLSRQKPPQLVLCDLRLPRQGGVQFCREIHQLQDPANPCLIVATGNGCASDRFRSLEAGADAYLSRPLDFSTFADLLGQGAGTALNVVPPGPESRSVRLRFWGVRGSIPTPGPASVHYGGNTSCVEVRAGSDIIVLDSGSGIRRLGLALVAEFKERPIHLSLLITHTHWDHIQGFPFFMPAYNPKNQITLVGFEGARQGLQSTLSSQMESPYFPVSMHQMPGHVSIQEVKGLGFKIGDVPVRAQFLNHPGACTGYRLSTPGGDICYLPDVELSHRLRADVPAANEQDRKVLDFIRDAEVLILDSQYTAEEYDKHVGWGHSCADDSVAFALAANVKRFYMFHHDPDHNDEQVSRMVARARQFAAQRGSSMIIEAAREGVEVVLNVAKP